VTLEGRKKTTKGGDIVIFETQDLKLVNADTIVMVAFEQVGCIIFCEKLQGYNMQVTKDVSLSFYGIGAKVGNIQFQVSEDTIVVVIEIPSHGEKWFKGIQLDLYFYHEFLKLEFRDIDFGAAICKELLSENYSRLLRVIKYFSRVREGSLGFTNITSYF
jgi:hypothetical protein